MAVAQASSWTHRLADALIAPARWVERARGRRRLGLLVLYAVVIAVAGTLLWWGRSLRDLPDIGDPFAAEAYRARTVAEGDDAFPLYREAGARLRRLQNKESEMVMAAFRPSGSSSPSGPWTLAGPEARAWAEANREGLLLWRRATNRPGLRVPEPGEAIDSRVYEAIIPAIREFSLLAMLEANRLENQGDMAGAWGWYRAVLRAHRHAVETSGSLFWGWGFDSTAPMQVVRWANDPRADAGLLRRALDEASAIDAATAPFSLALRGEYLRAMKELDEARPPLNYGNSGEEDWYKFLPLYSPGVVILKREPERSRRVLRLIYANLLAHFDDPFARRPRVLPPGVFDLAIDPMGKDPARLMTAGDLETWLASTIYARHLAHGEWFLSWVRQEQIQRAAILTGLARELYQREHGSPPKTDDDLIGPYLDRLPDGALGPGPP